MARQRSWRNYMTMGAVALDSYYASTARPLPQEEPKARPRPASVELPSKGGTVGIVILWAVCALLFALVVFGAAQVAELDRQISEMTRTTVELSAELDRVQAEFDESVDLNAVAVQARLMGMRSPAPEQIRYLVPSRPEARQDAREENGTLAVVLSAVLDTAKDLLEYLRER